MTLNSNIQTKFQSNNSYSIPNQPPSKSNPLASYIAVAVVIVPAMYVAYELLKLIREIVADRISFTDVAALEKMAKKHVAPNLIEKIKQMDEINHHYVFKRLAFCNADEKKFIHDLTTKFHLDETHLTKILCGAHVRIKDNGVIYEQWESEMASKKPRYSSHPSLPHKDQYGLEGQFVSELLFGVCRDETGDICSWFQLERNPVRFGHVLRHMVDYAKYKWSGWNQGPYGATPETHHNALYLELHIEKLKETEQKVASN